MAKNKPPRHPHAATLRANAKPDPRVMPVTEKLASCEMTWLRIVSVRTGKTMSEIVGAGLRAIEREGSKDWMKAHGFTDLQRMRQVQRNVSQNLKLTVDEEFTLGKLKDKGLPKGLVIGMITLTAWLALPEPDREQPWAA